MIETGIYVGLNDRDTKEQKLETERYVNILKSVCRNYEAAFSFSVQQGGYMHEDGTYTQENSLVLSLIDADKNLIDEIAKDLCVFFHQESVMITKEYVRAYFVREEL